MFPSLPRHLVCLLLCACVGLLAGLWVHDLLVSMMTRRYLAVSAQMHAFRFADPPVSPAALGRDSDAFVLEMCGFVSPYESLWWLRFEMDSGWFGVGRQLPDVLRQNLIYPDGPDVSGARSRWQLHSVSAVLAGVALALSWSVGARLGIGRVGRSALGPIAINQMTYGAFVMLFATAFLLPPLLFYCGYDRLQYRDYGFGSFSPPAVLLWPAVVLAGVFTGWAWGRFSAQAAQRLWPSTRAPLHCPACGYQWANGQCPECGSAWSWSQLRRIRRRVVVRAACALIVAGCAVGLGRVLWLPGPLSFKVEHVARWLLLRPTAYSDSDRDFMLTKFW